MPNAKEASRKATNFSLFDIVETEVFYDGFMRGKVQYKDERYYAVCMFEDSRVNPEHHPSDVRSVKYESYRIYALHNLKELESTEDIEKRAPDMWAISGRFFKREEEVHGN